MCYRSNVTDTWTIDYLCNRPLVVEVINKNSIQDAPEDLWRILDVSVLQSASSCPIAPG
jgi:hypothetical protein